MKFTPLIILPLIVLGLYSCSNSGKKTTTKKHDPFIDFIKYEDQNKIDITIGGELFTSYQWINDVFKPVLYPIHNSSGTEITRGFPLNPKPGERADHRHHVGNWLNYGDVNGNDFWGNGHTGKKSENGGEIIHKSIESTKSGKGEGTMISTATWIDSTGVELLSEKTELNFIATESLRIIDRITTLTALKDSILMPDTKEGMFAIRIARELELPSKGRITIVNEEGNIERLDSTSNKGITGNYVSSEGITGIDVWGTRAKWMHLFGTIKNEKISIVICDHPENINYPTYWHARGYGLFSANPLGVKDFTRGKEQLNMSIQKGKSINFKYRIIISSNKHMSGDEIDKWCEQFSQKY